MADYTSNTDLPAAARWLAEGQTIVILTHSKPDGDAWGSVVSLATVLDDEDRTVIAAFAPPVTSSLTELPGHELTITLDNGDLLPPEPDRVVLVDTGAWSQVQPFADYLKAHLDRTLIIDHHKTGDIPAAMRYIDSTAAATCEILADLFKLPPLTPAPSSLLPLYVGLATDTGFFRFSNTSPRTLRLAADLMERGVDTAALYEILELCERKEKLALTTCALDSLQWVAGDRAAVMTLRLDDFARTGALEEETERLVNIPLQVASTRASVLVCEKKSDTGVICRVSARSKATGETIDVAQLMSTFGGGGHARAAGARIDGDASAVTPRVVAALEQALS